MIFKFYQLFRSLKEVIGLDEAKKVFPEYESLKDSMSPQEQVDMARILMKRLDERFDKETVLAIRMAHPCGIPKQDQEIMRDIKSKITDIEERIKAYKDHINGFYIKLSENEYVFTWGLKSCVCGMFRKLKDYEPISPTWCQCCNGHNQMLFTFLLDKDVKSELLEGICSGGKTCSFKIKINYN